MGMRLFLMSLFATLCLGLSAQSYLGLELGTELSSFIQGGDPSGGSLFYSRPRTGLVFGLTGGLALKGRMVLHAEVDFAKSKTNLRRGFSSPGGSSTTVGLYKLNNATVAVVPVIYLGKQSRIFIGLGGFVSRLTNDPNVTLTSGGTFVGNDGMDVTSVSTKLRSEELAPVAYGLQLRGGYRYLVSERFSLATTLNVRRALNDVRQPYTFAAPMLPFRIGIRLEAWRTF